MGFGLGPGCCCGCTTVPRPYVGAYAKVTVSGVSNGTCSDCASVWNKTHKCYDTGTANSWDKNMASVASSQDGAQNDCSAAACGVKGTGQITVLSSLSGSERVVSSMFARHVDNVSPFNEKQLTGTCSGGTWSYYLTGSSTSCDWSSASISFEGFTLDPPYFCSSPLDWTIYDPTYTLSSTALQVTISGCTVDTSLNTTHNVPFSVQGLGILTYSSAKLTITLSYKQRYPKYYKCTAFGDAEEAISNGCQIARNGGLVTWKWQTSSSSWLLYSGDGTIDAIQFV